MTKSTAAIFIAACLVLMTGAIIFASNTNADSDSDVYLLINCDPDGAGFEETTSVTDVNKNDITGTGISGGVSYDSTTKILLLQNASINSDSGKTCLFFRDDITVRVEGNCTVTCNNGDACFYSDHDVTFIGSGSLRLINDKGCGIRCDDLTLRDIAVNCRAQTGIISGSTVNSSMRITGSDILVKQYSDDVMGTIRSNGNIVMDSGTLYAGNVIATGDFVMHRGDAEIMNIDPDPDSFALDADTITLNGGVLTILSTEGHTISSAPMIRSSCTVSANTRPVMTSNNEYSADRVDTFHYLKFVYKSNEQYTLTFVTFGGRTMDPLVQAPGSEIFLPDDPVRDGFLFGGWDRKVPNRMPSHDITFRAIWSSTPLASDVITNSDNRYVETEGNGMIIETDVLGALMEGQRIELRTADVSIGLTNNALSTISNGSKFSFTAVLTTGLSDAMMSKLNDNQKDLVSKASVVTVDFSAAGSTADLGKNEIIFPFIFPDRWDASNTVAYSVSDNGTMKRVDLSFSNGKAVITAEHFSTYMVCKDLSSELGDGKPVFTYLGLGLALFLILVSVSICVAVRK